MHWKPRSRQVGGFVIRGSDVVLHKDRAALAARVGAGTGKSAMKTRRAQTLRHLTRRSRRPTTQRPLQRGLFFGGLKVRRVLDGSELSSLTSTVSIEGSEDADRIVGFVRGGQLLNL